MEPKELWKGVKQAGSVGEAKKAAQESGKPIMLLLFLDGPVEAVTCLGSRLWKAHTFSDGRVISQLNNDYICIFVNISKAGIPVQEFPCLSDHLKQYELAKSFPMGQRMFDSVNIISITDSGKSKLTSVQSMLMMTDYEAGFSEETFLTILQKNTHKKGKLSKLVSKVPKLEFKQFLEQMPVREQSVDTLEKQGLNAP
jgi:hypothetical protein